MSAMETTVMLSEYGLYAIVSVLLFVVWHLYREQSRLEEEMRKILAEEGKDVSKLLVEATQAIKHSNDAFKKLHDIFAQMQIMMETFKR